MTEPLFKPGDRVGCIFDDRPYVLQDGHGGQYPLYIETENGPVLLTADGKYNVYHEYPVIWHWETGSPPKAGERPVWKPEKPTWCRVWNLGDTLRYEKLIVRYDEFYLDIDGNSWDCAEPCDPPDWWPSSWV